MVLHSISYNHRLLVKLVYNLSPASNVMNVITSSGIICVNTIFNKPVFKNRWQSSVHGTIHKTSNQKSVQIM